MIYNLIHEIDFCSVFFFSPFFNVWMTLLRRKCFFVWLRSSNETKIVTTRLLHSKCYSCYDERSLFWCDVVHKRFYSFFSFFFVDLGLVFLFYFHSFASQQLFLACIFNSTFYHTFAKSIYVSILTSVCSTPIIYSTDTNGPKKKKKLNSIENVRVVFLFWSSSNAYVRKEVQNNKETLQSPVNFDKDLFGSIGYCLETGLNGFCFFPFIQTNIVDQFLFLLLRFFFHCVIYLNWIDNIIHKFNCSINSTDDLTKPKQSTLII